MPIKEGYVSEKQAHEIACTHNNRKVCIKTVTNLRSALGAQKTSTGKWIYKKSACEKKWPRGKYRTEKRSDVSSNRVEKLKDEVACIAHITDTIEILANAMGMPYSHLAAEVILAIINSLKKEEIGKEV